MNKSSSSSSSGIGFVGLLTIVFIALKLLGKIDWSWLWVLSPLWIGFCVLMAVLFLLVIIAFIIEVNKKKRFRT